MMADDHGWGDTGYNGHPFVKTPHLDQMASDGLRFDRWYAAAPVCSPTRGSCLTGRHPHRYGVYFANTGSLKSQEDSLAEVLKNKDYATGHFGKWHLGSMTTKVKDSNRGGPGSEQIYSPPWDNGFDVCFSTESKVPTFNPMMNPPTVAREAKRNVPEGGFYGAHYWTGPDQSVDHDQLKGDDSQLIMNHAVDFIKTSTKTNKPFFAVIWFHAPHTPVLADEQHRGLYPNHPHGLYGQHYHGCITALDEQVGRLRSTLKSLGVEDNTMVWYASDNGPESDAKKGAGSAGEFRGRKRSLYEGGIRVPGLLVWPSRVRKSRSINMPTVSSDLLPTICEAIGIKRKQRPYDGVSLLPLIDGTMDERQEPIGFQSRNQLAYIGQQYKLYSKDKGETWELYDLTTDPGENNDIAAAQPERVETMSLNLKKWIHSCSESDAGKDYAVD
ncbi:UNVERIFIED_CONTAM: hypothetical protein GTU68_049181 [Idotea baltica]|nr:hypothetical protein [Idotea baltica]